MKKELLTRDEIMSLVSYDDKTGLFVWRKPRPRCTSGNVAGGITRYGYWKISLKGRNYLAHRLAWIISKGSWPKMEIDHINGDPLDNRLDNLREATPHQNQANKGMRIDNTSGVKGVTWDKNRGLWIASLSHKRKHIHLGRYANIDEAAEAYRLGSIKYFGEYSRPEVKK